MCLPVEFPSALTEDRVLFYALVCALSYGGNLCRTAGEQLHWAEREHT